MGTFSACQLVLLVIMSDKFREFIEVPQQFIRDGNQVLLSFMSFYLFAHSYSVPYTLHKTFTEGFALTLYRRRVTNWLSRIPTDLQGSPCRFCSNGFYWLFRQAHPYSNVCHSHFSIWHIAF